MGKAFTYTVANSAPFTGLDGTVVFSDGTATSDKLKITRASGFGMDGVTPQTQTAPFQQGASLIRTQFTSRQIVIECAIAVQSAATSGYAEISTIRESLAKRLSPVGLGFMPDTSLSSSEYSTYVGQLAYASDGVTYNRYIDVMPMTIEYGGTSFTDGFQKVRFVFFCPSPFWYGATQSATLANVSVGLSATWISIAWSPYLRLFCAIGQGSTSIQTSPDGITWTLRTGAAASNWNSVCWAPELRLFCAVAQSTANVQTSPDGITWTLRTGAASQTWNAVCWSPELGLFCAISASGTSRVQTSPDGINWTLRTAASASLWRSICWSPQRRLFCAVANTSTDVQTSPDGITWTARTGAIISSSVVWAPELGIFCGLGVPGTSNVETSPDGITWTSRTGASVANWYAMAWSPALGLFCAVAYASTSIQTSPDGINWTSRTGAASSQWGAICWADDIGAFCAVAFSGGQYPQISYDAIHWVQNSATTDWYASVPNSGHTPTPFQLTIPIAGAETGKVIAIGENFLWAGAGDPPSDHNLVLATDSLPVGEIVIDTTFGSKSIKQFGKRINNSFTGSFFTLYVTGTQSNILYVRNTGTASRAPSITWKNRYISV